ncbi:MAG: hypothetical protein ACQEQN_12270, partial [Thermodesulfobacteriota bacterium]
MNLKNLSYIRGVTLLVAGIAAMLCTLLLFLETPLASSWSPAEHPPENPAADRYADPYEALEQSFRRALFIEQEKLAYLSERVSHTESRTVELGEAYAGHQVMVSDHAGMLAAPDIDLQSLTRAQKRLSAELGYIEDRVSLFSSSIREFENRQNDTEEQLSFYTRQIENLKAQPPGLPLNEDTLDPLESLVEVLEEKQEKLERLVDHYANWEERYLALENDLKNLSARYESAIYEREKERLLQHGASPIVRIAQGALGADLARFSEDMREIFSTRFWYKPEDVRWDAYGIFLAIFLFLFLALQGLLCLLTRYLGAVKAQAFEQHYFYRHLFLQLVQRSVLVVGAIAFFHFYPVRPAFQLAPFFVLFPVFIRILVLFLGVHWILVFLRGMRRHTDDPLFLRLLPLLRGLLVGIFFYGTVYIFVSRMFCADCLLLTSWRLLGQLFLFGWTAYFLKLFYINASGSILARYKWFENARTVVLVTGLAVVLTGILAEVTGYGGVAVLWFVGLWHTTLVLLWGYILFGVLKESDVSTYIEKSDDLSEDDFEEQPYPVRWLIVRVMRLALVILLLFSLPLAWGAGRTFLIDLFYAVNFRVKIGDFEFRAMGVVYAAMVLLIIHTLSVLWKSGLKNRILYESDMEEGVKDSITRISGYGLWGIGIIIAMQMIGISGTS